MIKKDVTTRDIRTKDKYGLTPKQKAFCDEYLIDKNGTRAAIEAGYKENVAAEIASQNLRKQPIVKYINNKLARIEKRNDVKVDEVIRELKLLSFSNIQDYVHFGPDGVRIKDSNELTREQSAAVSEVSETIARNGQGGSQKFKLYDKLDALDKLARHLGMYRDERPAAIQVNIGISLEEKRSKLLQLLDIVNVTANLPECNKGVELREGEGDR